MRLKKLLMGALLSAVVPAVALVSPGQAAAASLPVYLGDRQLYLPAPTVIKEDRLLVPMRGFVESVAGEIEWTPPGRITAHLHGQTVTMTIGSREAAVGDRAVTLDVPAQLIGDRTYVPVRFLSEGLGAQVSYDGASVRVEMKPTPQLLVNDGPLNVRSSPSVAATVLTAVPAGTRLDVVANQGTWAQVRLLRGQTGWISTQFTKPVAPVASAQEYTKLLNEGSAYLEVGGDCLGLAPLIDGKLYAPVRPVVERLGGQTRWSDGATVLSYQGREVVVQPDTNQVVAVADQLFVPARELAGWLGVRLDWYADRRTAAIGGSVAPGACNPRVQAGSYLIMDAGTGTVLAEQAADVQVPIASTTKIMTVMLALERGRLSDSVTVSPKAAATEGTRMELRRFQQVTVQDLLYGAMLPSGNDATVAIAEYISGSEAAFAQLMTRRAAELGARNTLFYTASGLDDYAVPYSTARDLGRIARQAMADPFFRALAGAKEYWFNGRKLVNKNDFVLKYSGATGVKNGWTERAEHTLVASAYRGDTELLVVVLGAGSRDSLYRTAYSLMDRGFALHADSWLLDQG